MLIPSPSPASVRLEIPEGKCPLVGSPREAIGSNFKKHPESIISYYFYCYPWSKPPSSLKLPSSRSPWFYPCRIIHSQHCSEWSFQNIRKISHTSTQKIARTLHFTQGKKAKYLWWPSRPCVMLPHYYSVLFSYCVPTCPPFPGPLASLPSTSLPQGLCSNVPFAHHALSPRESLGSLPLLLQAYL